MVKHNILFLYSRPILKLEGGVERVSYVLSKHFRENGCNTYFLSVEAPSDKNEYEMHQFFFPVSNPNSPDFLQKNREFLDDFIKDKNIDIIVNQDGFNANILSLYADVGNGVKKYAVLHNSVLDRIINFYYYKEYALSSKKIKALSKFLKSRFAVKFLLMLYKLKYRRHFRRLSEKNDKVILLSDKYKPQFFELAGKSFDNIISIPNPNSFVYDNDNIPKKKQILYVGRIDFSQKRVDLLLRIWSRVWKDFKDWKFAVLGDGALLGKAKELAKNLKIENIEFKGFKSPVDFYKESSILVLASSFEGFPMVIGEAMQNSCVPVVFNSFAAAGDMIANGENGILVDNFDIDAFCGELKKLMGDSELLSKMAQNSKNSIRRYNIENILPKWLALFD